MAKEVIQHYTSEEIQSLIRAKYPGPAWTVLSELRDGTGFNTAGRSADAVAFSVWPSRGLQIYGFEIKSHRGDWINELKKPEKAESIARFCDAWYLVCAENVAKLEEIPAAWGWLVPTSKGLKEMKAPQVKDPVQITRIFLMSIMRSLEKNYVPSRSVESQVALKVKEKMEYENREAVQTEKNYQKLKAQVAEFKEASGLDIENEWRVPAKELGRAVKAVLHYDEHIDEKVRRAEVDIKTLTETCESLRALKMVNVQKDEVADIKWKVR